MLICAFMVEVMGLVSGPSRPAPAEEVGMFDTRFLFCKHFRGYGLAGTTGQGRQWLRQRYRRLRAAREYQDA